MAHVLQIPPIPGGEALLALLADDSAAKDYLQRMMDMRAEVNEMISAVGTVKEINSLAVKARGDREKASAEFVKAEGAAADILAGARECAAKADERLGSIEKVEVVAKADIARRNGALTQRIKNLTAREESVTARETAVQEAAIKAKSTQQAATAMKSKYKEALDRIARVVDEVG